MDLNPISEQESRHPQHTGDPPHLVFKRCSGQTDIRTIEGNRRVGLYHREISHMEAETYSIGYLAGFEQGRIHGEKWKSYDVIKRLGLNREQAES